MTAAWYRGWVAHRRLGNPDHRFRARVEMVLVDLADVDALVGRPLWSAGRSGATHRRERVAPLQLRRRDLLDGSDRPLDLALADLVEARTGRRPDGPMRVLTQPRRLGWLFNPLSVYWCDHPDGSPQAVVLEVTNTPWHERHWYVVEPDPADLPGQVRSAPFPKAFHVSPFLPMDLAYRLTVDAPVDGPHLRLGLQVDHAGTPTFEARLDLDRAALTTAGTVAALARRPWSTMAVSAGIHRQAAALAAKGATFHPHPGRSRRPGRRPARRVVQGLLSHLDRGSVSLHEPRRRARVFGPGDDDSPSVQVRVHDPRAYRAVLAGASVGLGDGYAEGWWDTDDLPGLLGLLARTTHRHDLARQPVVRAAGRGLDQVRRRRAQDPGRDRRNIATHYDLGNDFFALMLDETMTYSGAVFTRPDDSLAQASTEKLDRLCRLLELAPDTELVEIGTGWGSLAAHAAGCYGARVTTTTISAEQFAYARSRMADRGLSDRVEVRHDDYRRLSGTFDRLASVEMVEAVDWRELDTYLATCDRLLRPDGRMGLQTIVIPDERYEARKNGQDFVKARVFPGGCLHSLGSIRASLARTSDLRIVEQRDYGPDYAETLRRWRTNLAAHRDQARVLGFDERFLRQWDFYLSYCEAGFATGDITVVQLLLTR